MSNDNPRKMKTRKILKPGQPGTKKWMEKYGDRLFCVRYRYNEASHQKITTIELIVEKNHWKSNSKFIPRNKIMSLQVDYSERHMRRLIKEAGGRWNQQKKVWELPYGIVLDLGLKDRITE